jgi:hypothetical protein
VTLENIDQKGGVETTGNHIGGIIGLVRDTSVVTLSSIAQFSNISGTGTNTTDLGGLIGQVRNSSEVFIENAFNYGSVNNINGSLESGGLIGRVGEDTNNVAFVRIENAYNAGEVTSNPDQMQIIRVGSIIAKVNQGSQVTLSGVFYLSGTAILNSGVVAHSGTVNGSATPVSIAQLAAFSTFNNAGWDIAKYPTINQIWSIQFNGQTTYPWLTSQGQPHASQITGVIPVFTGSDLKTIEDNLFGSFELQNNIDLVSFGTLDRSFIDATFTGNLSGQGFTIENLKINGTTNIGLFREFGSGAYVNNVTLSAFSITSSANQVGKIGRAHV